MMEIEPLRPDDTQEGNARARLLYDKVARFNGFIRYGYPL